MIYLANLNTNQKLYLENRGSQTLITLMSSSSGQQQSQSNSFETGSWTTPPTLFGINGNFLLRIDAVGGQHFIQLQANGFNVLKTAPSLMDADVIPLEKVSETRTSSQSSGEFQPMEPIKPMESMKPMQPMKPMKLGDMSMNMNPMEMQMGNMYMRMPEDSQQSSQSKQHFCTQCGNLVETGDRFCANCGHKLKD